MIGSNWILHQTQHWTQSSSIAKVTTLADGKLSIFVCGVERCGGAEGAVLTSSGLCSPSSRQVTSWSASRARAAQAAVSSSATVHAACARALVLPAHTRARITTVLIYFALVRILKKASCRPNRPRRFLFSLLFSYWPQRDVIKLLTFLDEWQTGIHFYMNVDNTSITFTGFAVGLRSLPRKEVLTYQTMLARLVYIIFVSSFIHKVCVCVVYKTWHKYQDLP